MEKRICYLFDISQTVTIKRQAVTDRGITDRGNSTVIELFRSSSNATSGYENNVDRSAVYAIPEGQ